MSPDSEKALLATLASIDLSLREIAQALKSAQIGAAKASGGGWRDHKLPAWPKYDAGKALGEISDKSLAYWVGSFVPKPWVNREGVEKPPSAADVALRRALDAAAAEMGLPLPDGYEAQQSAQNGPQSASERPSPARQRPAEAPEAPIDDEDVPF